MFIWMAKFGAAYGVRTGIHVGVDVLINRLPDNLRRKYVLFGLFCRRGCSPSSSARSAPTTSWAIGHTDQISRRPRVPLWIVYLCIPLRLLPDVLPLPAGRMGVLPHR